MRDANLIQTQTFYIDNQLTQATNTWITQLGEIYISLLHPKGGQMNVHAKDLHKYTKPQSLPQPIPEPQI